MLRHKTYRKDMLFHGSCVLPLLLAVVVTPWTILSAQTGTTDEAQSKHARAKRPHRPTPAPGGTSGSLVPDKCEALPLPFATIEVKHPIDQSCGINGKPSSPQNSQIQNAVKNNFCAGKGAAPATYTPQMLVDLQGNTKVKSGYKQEPADRKPLQDLGEGKLIRMKAYFFEAHYADLGNGESVNCNGGSELENDIHIALVAQANDQECQSVTAEISPHYRPDSWAAIGHDETYDSSTKTYTPDPRMETLLRGRAFRFTGQLFFDASHQVCPCGVKCSPVRASLWEIHPVYAIDVCKTGSQCDENNDSEWESFDHWWSGTPTPVLGQSLTPRKPHKHPAHEAAPGTRSTRKATGSANIQ